MTGGGSAPASATSFLNTERSLLLCLAEAFQAASELDVAVAYAKLSGVRQLLELGLPASSRFLIGTGFALTEPKAVELLHRHGAAVRLFFGDADCSAAGFHLKTYLLRREGQTVCVTGSGNLTSGGLGDNLEQFVEQVLDPNSQEAGRHSDRFELLWRRGIPLSLAREEGIWERYEETYAQARIAERATRRKLGPRLAEQRRRSRGASSGSSSSSATNGYIANTHPDWWDYMLENSVPNPAFWRSSTSRFRALRDGGYFLHIVNEQDGHHLGAQDRVVVGYSRYRLGHRVLSVEEAWREYGYSLGCRRYSDIARRFARELKARIGVIELHAPVAFAVPPTLEQLAEVDVPFQREIVSGRRMTDIELAKVFALAGEQPPDLH